MSSKIERPGHGLTHTELVTGAPAISATEAINGEHFLCSDAIARKLALNGLKAS